MSDYDPRSRIDPFGTNPRLDRPQDNGLGLVAVVAAIVLAVVVAWSFMNGETRVNQDARAPGAPTTTSAPAQQRPAPDPTTTGTVPRQTP